MSALMEQITRMAPGATFTVESRPSKPSVRWLSSRAICPEMKRKADVKPIKEINQWKTGREWIFRR